MRSRSHFFRLPTIQFQIVTLTGESCVEQLHLFPWMRTGHGGKVFSLTPHPTYITFKSNHNISYFLLVYMTMNTRVTKLKNLYAFCGWIYRYLLTCISVWYSYGNIKGCFDKRCEFALTFLCKVMYNVVVNCPKFT